MKARFVWFVITFVVFIAAITIYYNQSSINLVNFKVQDDVKIEPNDWQAIQFIDSKDTSSVIKVVYQEKYGSEKTILCNVIFENIKTNEYKCTSPWSEKLVLQKSNLNSISYNIVRGS